MNRLTPYVATTLSLGGLLLGCGDPEGVRAEGSVALAVRQAGQSDGSAGFSFPADTYIDAPPGVGRGFYGTCVRNGSRWTIDLARADVIPGGLRRTVLTMTEGNTAGSASASFTLGTSEFSGNTECMGSALPRGDRGVSLSARCVGLRASSDPRTVDATVALTLTRCDLR